MTKDADVLLMALVMVVFLLFWQTCAKPETSHRYSQVLKPELCTGIDWTSRENWGCNAELEADDGENYYDGISIHPLEVSPKSITSYFLAQIPPHATEF